MAVGGTNGFFDDSLINSPYPKPWSNGSPTALKDFWDAKDQWYPTWAPDINNGEQAAMKVCDQHEKELSPKYFSAPYKAAKDPLRDVNVLVLSQFLCNSP